MYKSLETTSEATDDQEEMNNCFQSNELAESRWLAIAQAALREALQLGEQTGTAHHFYPLYSSSTCPGKFSPSRILKRFLNRKLKM